MSWMLVIAAALLLANLAVAVRARQAPARTPSEEERLRQAVVRKRAEETARETS